jgi:short-subunit dehydrogenase|tara:strand:+ start:472 stop:1266 length:795 start_codon:yes stop_codon:yes gene_type:complete
MIDYKNKTVWITGASSGIGRALAIQFSAMGANLILSARNNEKLLETLNMCSHQLQIKLLPLDLEDYESVGRKSNTALALFGGIDLLINNGGISQRGMAVDTPISVDKKIIDINYFGTVALSKAILPHFIEKKSGQIAVTSSVVGKFGSPLRTSYAASKHAIHGFFDSLRAEVNQYNIGVTIVCPGPINTNISENAITASGKSQNKKDDAIAGGISPEVLAKKYIKALQKNKQEAWIGKKEVFAIYIKRFFPTLFSRIIRNVKVT